MPGEGVFVVGLSQGSGCGSGLPVPASGYKQTVSRPERGDKMSEGVVTISKEDFAHTLYCWLSEHLAEQEVREMAKQVAFKLERVFRLGTNKKVYAKFHSELFALNMYLIVFTCEGMIEDGEKRRNVLGIFHQLVYDRNIKVTGIGHARWRRLMEMIYDRYRKSMEEKGSLLTPVLLVAHEFERNLFGALTLDPYLRFETGMRIGGMVKQLSQLLQEYDIE